MQAKYISSSFFFFLWPLCLNSHYSPNSSSSSSNSLLKYQQTKQHCCYFGKLYSTTLPQKKKFRIKVILQNSLQTPGQMNPYLCVFRSPQQPLQYPSTSFQRFSHLKPWPGLPTQLKVDDSALSSDCYLY